MNYRIKAVLETLIRVKGFSTPTGLPTNVRPTSLFTHVEEFTAAMQMREGGLDEQVGGTTGLASQEKNAVRLLQKLDATMSNLLATNPALMGSWKRTVHIPRTPVGSGAGGGTGTPATV